MNKYQKGFAPIILVIIAVVVCGGGILAWKQGLLPKISTKILTPDEGGLIKTKLATIPNGYEAFKGVPFGLRVALSPDGSQVAYWVTKNGKVFMMINDKMSQAYTNINEAVFSPDSKQIAYKAEREGKKFVVLNGQEGKAYDGIDYIQFVGPKKDQLCYFAIKKEEGKEKRLYVINGKETKIYDLIWGPYFSPDGKQIFYSAEKEGKDFAVLNDVESEAYDDIQIPFYMALPDSEHQVLFSPDSKHIAYTAKREGRTFVVIDGKENKDYDWSNDPLFSPDSKKIVYTAGRDGDSFFVIDDIDGKEKKTYELCGRAGYPVFGPDSQKLAYTESCSGEEESEGFWEDKCFLVINGKKGESRVCEEVGDPIFSLDNKQVAYTISTEGKASVIVNDKEGKAYEEILFGPIFSPDGNQVVYTAKKTERVFIKDDYEEVEKEFIVIGDKEGKEYDGIDLENDELVFSPDKKQVVYVAIREEKTFVVVGDNEGEVYDDISNLTFSPDGKTTAYIASIEFKEFVVVGNKKGDVLDEVLSSPIFSSDGKHISYGARKDLELLWVIQPIDYNSINELKSKDEKVGEEGTNEVSQVEITPQPEKRDFIRKADLKQIANALEMYFDAHSQYFTVPIDACSAQVANCKGIYPNSIGKLLNVPQDPLNNAQAGYYYRFKATDSQKFCLIANKLETKPDKGFYVAYNGAGELPAGSINCPNQ